MPKNSSSHSPSKPQRGKSCRSESWVRAPGCRRLGEWILVIPQPGNRVPCSVSVSCVTCRACEAVCPRGVILGPRPLRRFSVLLLLLPLAAPAFAFCLFASLPWLLPFVFCLRPWSSDLCMCVLPFAFCLCFLPAALE